MSKAFKWSLGILILSVMAIVVSSVLSPETTYTTSIPTVNTDRELITLGVGNVHELRVEAVTTPESITQGLSGRTEIGSEGMLFVLPERRAASFWMRDMLFDLDMVWIDGSVVVKIDEAVPAPAPGAPLSELPSYSSEVPVTHVLELPSGKAGELGISEGSLIGHRAIME